MNQPAFLFLLLSLATPLGPQLFWLAPIHLFMHMRGTYRISVIGTLVRMTLLFLGSAIAFGLLVGGLVIVGLATAH